MTLEPSALETATGVRRRSRRKLSDSRLPPAARAPPQQPPPSPPKLFCHCFTTFPPGRQKEERERERERELQNLRRWRKEGVRRRQKTTGKWRRERPSVRPGICGGGNNISSSCGVLWLCGVQQRERAQINLLRCACPEKKEKIMGFFFGGGFLSSFFHPDWDFCNPIIKREIRTL